MKLTYPIKGFPRASRGRGAAVPVAGRGPVPFVVRVGRVRWQAARWMSGIGWPGTVALGLMAFCAVFSLSWVLPEQGRLKELQGDAVHLRDQAARRPSVPGVVGTADRLAAFYRFFPHPDGVPDLLQKIFAAADQQTLKLEQGDYRVLRDGTSKLSRYQIALPVKGSYPQIRKFVSAVLADVPAASLENIQFERQKVGDTTVEAKINLVVYLGQGS